MTIEQLIQIVGQPDPPKVCTDSRAVRPGDVFVAIKGPHQDGHRFIDQAIAKGARYIVCQQPPADRYHDVELIMVSDTTLAAAQLAQARFGWPSLRLINLAVTGTNGKTTVTYLVRHCLEKAGIRSGLLGTISYDTGNQISPAELTTPDALTIAAMQAQMLQTGCTHMVMEASSHALLQGRCGGIRFAAAAFTNLTRDHLDYHKDMDSYLAAKAILFEGLSKDAVAVLNADCSHSRSIASRTMARCIWYGLDHDAELRAYIESMDSQGTTYTLQYKGQQIQIRSPLLGRHNVSNHLAAAGLCLALGMDLPVIKKGLEGLRVVPGRLERIQWPGPFDVIVDFAHTEDALRNVLTTLRPMCKARLIVVFGCGGDRDQGKRPKMARTAQELADIVVITSDNPRTEDPAQIISQILSGLIDPDPDRVHVQPDRRLAIGWAIRAATSGDIVIIAGKGHESYQIIGTTRYLFSDQQVAKEFLEKVAL